MSNYLLAWAPNGEDKAYAYLKDGSYDLKITAYGYANGYRINWYNLNSKASGHTKMCHPTIESAKEEVDDMLTGNRTKPWKGSGATKAADNRVYWVGNLAFLTRESLTATARHVLAKPAWTDGHKAFICALLEQHPACWDGGDLLTYSDVEHTPNDSYEIPLRVLMADGSTRVVNLIEACAGLPAVNVNQVPAGIMAKLEGKLRG